MTPSVAGPIPLTFASSPDFTSGARSSASRARTAFAAPRYARDLKRFSARSSRSAAISERTWAAVRESIVGGREGGRGPWSADAIATCRPVARGGSRERRTRVLALDAGHRAQAIDQL